MVGNVFEQDKTALMIELLEEVIKRDKATEDREADAFRKEQDELDEESGELTNDCDIPSLLFMYEYYEYRLETVNEMINIIKTARNEDK
tara:strand:- start:936 stop:1202 length:267 start_codon:yes stop_codon:yes gene_type:complete